MNEESIKLFLAQFDIARKEIESWPRWMQENARVATASLPKSGVGTYAKKPTSQSTPEKK